MQRPVLTLALSGLVALALACGGGSLGKRAVEPAPGSIKIGFLYNLDSGYQNFDREMAARMAADEINALGGVNGQKVEILATGDRINAPGGLMGAQSLLDQGVVAIVGGSTSPLTIATANLAAPKGVPLCAPSSTAPSLTNLQVNGVKVSGDLTWRTAPSDTFQGRVLAQQVYAAGIRSVALAFRNDSYGQGLSGTFVETFTTLGGRMLATVPYAATQTSGFTAEVSALFAGGIPEGVLLVSFTTDGAALTRDIRAYAPSPMPAFFGGDAVVNTDFLANADPLVLEGMRGTSPSPPTGWPGYAEFVARFQARMGYQPLGAPPAAAYDAVYLFALAMAKDGHNTSQAIRSNLRAVSGGLQDGGSLVMPGQFALAQAIFKSGGAVNFEGASGRVDFDANGDVTSSSYAWWKIQERTFSILKVLN